MVHGNGDMMDDKMRAELREAMNIQFRYKLYRDPVFPFLPSLGVDHIIQGFENKEEDEFVGVLHLWYENTSGEPSYHTKDKHFVAGIWKHEWYDQPIDAYHLARYIQYKRPYDEDKIVQVILKHAQKVAAKKVEKIIKENIEEEIDDELLN